MDKLLIGTSAFYNGKWKGIFYPETLASKEWFAFYCAHFNTFEINATFYKFPTLKTMQGWNSKSPEGFTYAVKAPKLITHIKRFENCSEEIRQFYEVCQAGLQEKLGALLFQLPPSFSYSEQRLELILSNLDPALPNVVEFRHKSWWRDDVSDALEKNNTAFCTPSYPGLPDDVIITRDIAYIRLHGTPKLFYSSYAKDDLMRFLAQAATAKTVFIYFNNTASAAGIENALLVKSLSPNALSLGK
ncbi:DUF72 domain-containing protein [Flavobacterium sp. D33]|nr:DUF72 domain-containing protein [Flavobacterium selenitireducens]